jgi:hypothetical protein
MFGIAGATNASSSGGGDLPASGLLAEFSDPGSNYSGGTWTDIVDGSYKWEQGTADNRPSSDGDKLTFDGTNDVLDGNAALKGIHNGNDDYTLVVIADVKNRAGNSNDYIFYGTGSPNLYTQLYVNHDFHTPDSLADIKSLDYRSGAYYATSGVDEPHALGPHIYGVSSERAGNVVLRVDDEKYVGDAVGDVACANYTGNLKLFSSGSTYTDGDLYLVRIYDYILSDDDWSALRTFFSDNADYGLTGVTL